MVFVSIEINQIVNLGIDYFKDVFNIFELTQFILFLTYFTVKFTEDYPPDSILLITILLVLVIQSFMKVMFFVRVFEQYGFLVTMVGITIKDAVPFIYMLPSKTSEGYTLGLKKDEIILEDLMQYQDK